MPEERFQEKTEKATPRRREKAREKGQVARSHEIPTVLVLMASLGIFFFAGSWMILSLLSFMVGIFQDLIRWQIDSVDAAGALMVAVSRNVFAILAPFLLALVVAGVAANIAQFGLMFNFSLLSPNFSKLNPLRGLKKLVSQNALIEVFKSTAKIAIICFAAYAAVIADMDSMPALIQLPAVQIFQHTGQMVMKIGLYSALTLILLAGIDYVYQRWEHEKNLRMTKQEVKDEIRQSEGDPIIKARIRAIQREISRRRRSEM